MVLVMEGNANGWVSEWFRVNGLGFRDGLLVLHKEKRFQEKEKKEDSSKWQAFTGNLSTKQGSLFCFVLFHTDEIHHQTGMFQIAFLVSLGSSQEEGCIIGLVPWCLDLRCKSSLNIE
jgi:hypothetical protein